MRAGRFAELRAQGTPNLRVQGALPQVEALQQRPVARRPRHIPTELMRIFQLREELDRIVDAVDPESQRIHVEGSQRDAGLAVGAEGLGTG